MRTIEREKPHVFSQTRSNPALLDWRGQFTPEFIEYLLDEANEGTGLVLDPFFGSGMKPWGNEAIGSGLKNDSAEKPPRFEKHRGNAV